MAQRRWMRLVCLAVPLVCGCAGTRPDPGPAQQDVGAGPVQDGGPAQADGLAGADTGAKTGDGAACPVVPAGLYAGAVKGARTGTIRLELTKSGTELSLAKTSAITFDSTSGPKVFPLLPTTVICGKLDAIIGAPDGATGGTPYRGQVRGTFTPTPTPRFVGDWNMPGSDTGTFTAKQ